MCDTATSLHYCVLNDLSLPKNARRAAKRQRKCVAIAALYFVLSQSVDFVTPRLCIGARIIMQVAMAYETSRSKAINISQEGVLAHST